MGQVKWSVKIRHDNSKSFKTVYVYSISRDTARKAALDVYAKQCGTYFGYAACEASKVKGA